MNANTLGFFCAAALFACAAVAAPNAKPRVVVQDDSGKASASGIARIAVDPAVEVGPIKPMNGVNNGPNFCLDPNRRKEFRSGRFAAYRDMRTPIARIHDARDCASPKNHMCDISCIFPNPDADENDPASYDFTLTDWYFASIRCAGTEIMYRLGNSAESGPKSYGVVNVPKDFAKWARVAEHVVRHYNEGWGWTTKDIPFKNQFNIRYWEIWNEADLGCPASYWTKPTKYWREKPRFWNGSPEQFFEFYAVVAKHLKSTFPDLKIGGPSVAGNPPWTDHFLGYCATNSVPIDFFSWHIYAERVEQVENKAKVMKDLMVKHGYGSAESVLNEWNWNTLWEGDAYRAASDMRTDPNNYKMAAFYAGVMSAMQDSSADILMYYDARMPTCWNGIFNAMTQRPTKGYFPTYAWSKLADLGTQVKSTVSRGPGVRVTAAKGKDGAIAMFISRYTRDANYVKGVTARIAVSGRSMAKARCHLTDDLNRYTEVPIAVQPDGTAELDLDPNVFAFIEIPAE